MSVKTIILDNFSGGISGNDRKRDYSSAAMIKHFYIDNNRLIPNREMEDNNYDGSDQDGMKQYDVYNFRVGSEGGIYGMGVNSSGYPKIVKRSPVSPTWILPATAEGNAARVTGSLIDWQEELWMFSGTTNISKWTKDGTFTNVVATIGEAIDSVAQAIIGSDDNMYMFYNNKVVRVTPSGTVEDDVLPALPSDMRITSVCRYGSYLAIGMTEGKDGFFIGRSQVFLWDMVTQTTISDIIDWGAGALMCLANIEERLVGVTDEYLAGAYGINSGYRGGKMVIKIWSGGLPRRYKEISTTDAAPSTYSSILSECVVKNDKLYFVARLPFNGSNADKSTWQLGIYSFGRQDKDGDFILSIDVVNDDIDTDNPQINSFGVGGDFWVMNHSADGSLSMTNRLGRFGTVSIFETQKIILNGGRNKLVSVGVIGRVATTGQLVLKYQADEYSDRGPTWNEIFTTSENFYHEAVNIESDGSTLPEFREIKFRVESTDYAEIHGLVIKYESKDDDLTS